MSAYHIIYDSQLIPGVLVEHDDTGWHTGLLAARLLGTEADVSYQLGGLAEAEQFFSRQAGVTIQLVKKSSRTD